MRTGIAEAELQHSHARDAVVLAQGMNIRRNVTQIFGKERQPTKFLLQLVEQLIAWPIHPAAVNGRFLVRGDFPELREPAEMIEPDQVAGLRRPAQALHPPFESAPTHYIPVVKRIAPALACCAKRVRRNSRYHLSLKILTQTPKLALRPDIRAIVVHKDGDIADHANRFLRAVMPQGVPLLPKKELNHLANGDFGGEFSPCLLQGFRLVSRQVGRPFLPYTALVA